MYLRDPAGKLWTLILKQIIIAIDNPQISEWYHKQLQLFEKCQCCIGKLIYENHLNSHEFADKQKAN